MERLDVVLPSAGLGTRIGAPVPKQFILLAGAPLIVHPLRAIARRPWLATLIIVHGPGQRDILQQILNDHGFTGCQLVEGGATRQESVRRGLAQVSTRRVIVHNAAVALVTGETLDSVAAIDDDCVTTTLPFDLSLVRGEDQAHEVIPRSDLKIINSPQSFRTDVLRECHARAVTEGKAFASEAELMMHYGKKVRLIPGPARNFKITTPLDLMLAEVLLAREALAGQQPGQHHAVA